MLKKWIGLWAALLPCLALCAQPREVSLTFLATTDVHGNYFPYDYINGTPGRGSLARVAAYVRQARADAGRDGVVLLDNGDILQGQPSAYFYNFVDTTARHVCADVLNFMGYDAATVGNHDVETGHAVYDRWAAQCCFPVLGANVRRASDGSPYWPPYVIIERRGVRIAVFGMVTPAIPQWLPRNLWSGLRFDDMVATARRYMPEMRRRADLVVGLFHSGVGLEADSTCGAEDASLRVAREVPGFDAVFCGHDHRRADLRVTCGPTGDSVPVLNPAAGAEAVARADFLLTYDGGRMVGKRVRGSIVAIDSLSPDTAFMARFAPQADSVCAFTSQVVGRSASRLDTRPAFFGASAFVDFIHELQLAISGAQISMAAPLSFEAEIPAGDIRVRDLFNLYKYENQLYVLALTGREIKDYLEYSYARWTAQMATEDDPLLLFREDADSLAEGWQRLRHPSYDFDSAAGLLYTVDVTKPAGQKVTIQSLADGSPFSMEATYRVAVNSYRGNGGGGHLTEGAGIAAAELPQRIVWSTDKDLRFYLMETIRRYGNIAPRALGQWKFVPESWAGQAAWRDAQRLFR